MPASESDDEFSNGELDDSAFEESLSPNKKKEVPLSNDRYDLALNVSASMDDDPDLGSPGGSKDGAPHGTSGGDGAAAANRKEKLLKNDKFDEALEVSASHASSDFPPPGSSKRPAEQRGGTASTSSSANMDDEAKGLSVKNDQFDAAFELSSEDGSSSVDTTASGKQAPRKRTIGDPEPAGGGVSLSERTSLSPVPAAAGGSAAARASAASGQLNRGHSSRSSAVLSASEDSGSEDESSSDEGASTANGDHDALAHSTATAAPIEGAYNAADYAHLNVSVEIKDLFQYILRYKPHDVELDTSLKCFVPDYIPTVGEMDAFVKVPRPDGQSDGLGLRVLDEPTANQSDATVLELQLRAVSKKRHGDVAVRSIENAHKSPQEIERWIASIAELHRSKPPAQVHYKRTMPDIDSLMEVWPEEFEHMLATAQLPGPELEMSLEDYAKALCAIMDVPVYDNIVESLHLLFTVFQEFKSNVHFAGAGANSMQQGPEQFEASSSSFNGGYNVGSPSPYK